MSLPFRNETWNLRVAFKVTIATSSTARKTDSTMSWWTLHLEATAWRYRATNVGYFSVGYYLLVFNSNGDLYDVIYTRDPQPIARRLDGRPAIALVRHEEGAPAHLYVGRLSASEVFRGSVFDLQQRSRFSGVEIQQLLP